MPIEIVKLDPEAKLPTIAHPTEDLGYDLYALEDTVLYAGVATPVRTGLSAAFYVPNADTKFGFTIKDRSSLALQNLTTSGGVIDSGYTGEIKVIMTNSGVGHAEYHIRKGDKIAQLLPTEVLTDDDIKLVEAHGASARGAAGFGSSGK